MLICIMCSSGSKFKFCVDYVQNLIKIHTHTQILYICTYIEFPIMILM